MKNLHLDPTPKERCKRISWGTYNPVLIHAGVIRQIKEAEEAVRNKFRKHMDCILHKEVDGECVPDCPRCCLIKWVEA